MENTSIGGAMLRDMFLMSNALLEKNKAHIDSLNVFPVPDGDTGSNMSMTMHSAVREIRECKSDKASDIAAAAALGALKGARGNSGVILSQIFRGISKSLQGLDEMDAETFSKALEAGADAAYKAVMRPKEGTMLTVVRGVATAVSEAKESGAGLYRLMDVMIEAGEATLKRTPELLPVLREAGVVDSGGKGLLVVLKGFKMVMDGEEVDDYFDESFEVSSAVSGDDSAEFEALDEIEFGYCTEFFIIRLDESFCADELDRFRDKLIKMGDSVVVVNESDFVKVHVHSNYPGKILQLAMRLGEVDNIKIDNLREQNRKILEDLKKNEKEIALVVISCGDGIDEVFRSMGANVIVQGGQTMNPSTETIEHAIRKANAKNVIILPNNGNIILAANQAAELSDRNVIVLHTKTMAQGLASALAFSADVPWEENKAQMEAAMSNVMSASVTYAVRNTSVNGCTIATGDIIGILENEITDVGTDVSEIMKAIVRRMMESKGEDAVVSLYYGEGVEKADAEALASELGEEYPDGEFYVEYGGQPLYYYFISAE